MEIQEIGLLAIKAETTYGTDPTPTAAANAIGIAGDAFSYSVASSPVTRKILDGTLDRLVGFNTLPNVTLKLRWENRGNYTDGTTDTDISSGAIAQALPIDCLLLAANLAAAYTSETTNGAHDGYVIYQPGIFTTQGPSVTCYWWSHLKLHKLLGGKVNLDKVGFEAGKICYIDFTVQGKYSAVTDATFPTTAAFTGQAVKPALWNPSTLTIGLTNAAAGGYASNKTPVVSSFEIELGNNIAMRPDALSGDNIAGFVITDYNPKGRINPEAVAEADSAFWADWKASTMRTITSINGSTAGNKFSAIVTAEMKSVNYADANKVRIHNVEFDIVKATLGATIGSHFQLKWF